MNKRRQTLLYVLSDFATAAFVWLLLNVLRYVEVAQYSGFESLASYLGSFQVVKGQLLIPVFWLTLYYFSGYYNIPFGKSRIRELFGTFAGVAVGVIFIFFAVILNDLPRSFTIYYRICFSYGAMQFLLTYAVRCSITLHVRRKMRRREWALNALVIGAGQQALLAKNDLAKLGYRITGFVRIDAATPPAVPEAELLGSVDDLPQLTAACPVDELVLAPDAIPDSEMIRILYSLYHYNLPIKIRVEKNNPLARGKVKTIHGIPFIEVTANNFSEAGKNIKHAMDKIVAVLVLTLLSPMYACIAFHVKRSSPGQVFFRQERIGYRGRPFTIYKFRTMYTDAGRHDPLLTERDDPRVTPFGRFLRKYRLDEFPQFWNVLKGDMSLVGPRPEQRYYIEQIVRRAPYYYLLHNVRPGITSWGMVKYGYADTVDKMIERLDYDIMYYENMSLSLDIMILAYTVRIVLTGKGV
ncbi:MAG: sugar transferase [Tannerella sp.]|jgi:exopolysaccharide biosynthesis polyprenyl glycosylphosphotransferase|nr:sugar transferase [Tannerella sp.]